MAQAFDLAFGNVCVLLGSQGVWGSGICFGFGSCVRYSMKPRGLGLRHLFGPRIMFSGHVCVLHEA